MFSSNSSQVSSAYNYIEQVFSTYVYPGTGGSITINNGIDLATYGGLVWIKNRNNASQDLNNYLMNSATGFGNNLTSNNTAAQLSYALISSVSTTGFTETLGFPSSVNEVSWTFRKQPKFFDIVTFTGTGSVQNIAHNLGSTPGCIIVKRTNASANWSVYHKNLNEYRYVSLNLATGETISSAFWNNTAPTSTVFTVGTDASVNASGGNYVAYLFASDAGGFGLTGTDNVITCGQFDTNGASNATVTLGYEPQFILFKSRNYADNWIVVDTMRGWNYSQGINYLEPNAAVVEANYSAGGYPTATGFQVNTGNPSSSYIYIAIRRGPMAVPTTGTSVYSPVARTGTGANATVTAGFTPDVLWYSGRNAYYNRGPVDKLRGVTKYMYFTSTGAEQTFTTEVTALTNTGMTVGDSSGSGDINTSGIPMIYWFLQRAPSFFDEVCYTGVGGANGIFNHNLGVVPDLVITKCRSNGTYPWIVWAKALYSGSSQANGYLNTNATWGQYNQDFSDGAASFTSTTFPGSYNYGNASGQTYVTYLFATCPGVSKVGSYTGNGSTQAIACGFTGGARFVLIKCTSATGDWYVYDTARGMTTSTDPYLLLDTTGAEVATLGSVTTTTGGFTVNAAILAAINTSSATYIFLAIA